MGPWRYPRRSVPDLLLEGTPVVDEVHSLTTSDPVGPGGDEGQKIHDLEDDLRYNV